MILPKKQWLELADEIHTVMVDKGFYNEDVPTWQTMALIESELFEAFEACRKDKRADLHRFRANDTMSKSNEFFKAMFDGTLKGCIETEITDAYIRILDFIGSKIGYTDDFIQDVYRFVDFPTNVINSALGYFKYKSNSKLWGFPVTNDAKAIRHIAKKVVPNDITKHSDLDLLAKTIVMLERVAEKLNFNLLTYIDIKMRYNKLRPYKHGKKF